MKPVLLTVVAAVGTCLVLENPGQADEPAWGTIKGQIVYGDDAIPLRKPIDVTKDKDHCLTKGPLFDETWVINIGNRGIRWVFVWLAPDPESGKKTLPIHPDLTKIKDQEVVMDQPCCQFVPHCLAMRTGQVLVAKNSAPIAHNVHWTGHPLKNPGGNVIIPQKKSHEIKDLVADKYPVKINCDIHGWMTAYVRIYDHPYFAVTDEDGKFEIKNAPAGNYRLVIWHEGVGYRGGFEGRNGEKITIPNGTILDLGKRDLKKTE